MNVSAIIRAVIASAKMASDGQSLSELQPGDKLTAQVVNILKDGRALLDLGHTRVLAQISFNVRPGQSLRLQVVDNGPVFHFRVEMPQHADPLTSIPTTEFIKVLTSDQQVQLANLVQQLKVSEDSQIYPETVPFKVHEAILQIGKLFEPVPIERPTDQITDWLKNAIQQKDPFFEKDLGDFFLKTAQTDGESKAGGGQIQLHNELILKNIKPQLLVFKQFLSEDAIKLIDLSGLDNKRLGQVRQSVDRLLAHVIEQQEKAIMRWQSGENQQVIVHLLPMRDPNPPLALKVYYPEKQKKNKSQNHFYCIALLLDMDRLGPVRADLTLSSQQLLIRFFVRSEAVQTLFRQNLEEIRESLKSSIKQLQMDVFLSPKKIESFFQEDETGAAAGHIDLTI